MELKLTKEGTEYILGVPTKPSFFSQVINYKKGVINSYSSYDEAKRARDELVKELGEPLLIHERITRRLE